MRYYAKYLLTPWTPMRFEPVHRGTRIRVGRCVRHEYVGGCIFRGQLRVCNYRMPRLFDGKRTFRKALGNRVEIMKRNRAIVLGE